VSGVSTETHCQGVFVCVDVLGDEFEVRAKCVVNATGPYTDFVRRLDSPKCRKICQPSSGVHVVLPEYYRLAHLLYSQSHRLIRRGLKPAELVVSFLLVTVTATIASTHFAYPRKDYQAELAWVAWLNIGGGLAAYISIHPSIHHVYFRQKSIDP